MKPPFVLVVFVVNKPVPLGMKTVPVLPTVPVVKPTTAHGSYVESTVFVVLRPVHKVKKAVAVFQGINVMKDYSVRMTDKTHRCVYVPIALLVN